MRQVVCDTCGRTVLLPPGETGACPSCGSALSAPQAEDQTQPLAELVVAAQDDGTTRPIDPTALPPPPSQSQPPVAEASSAASGGTPVWPGDPTTQALSADYAPPPASSSGASQPAVAAPAPRRGRGLVLSMLALMVVLAVVAAAGVLASAHVFPFAETQPSPTATAVPAPSPTPTGPPGYVLYRDAQGAYQVYHPADWVVEPQGESGSTGIALVKPNSPAGMAILQQPLSGAATNQALVDMQFQQLARQGTITNRQQLADSTVGGATWAQGSADWLPRQQGAVNEHVVVLATVHDGQAFVIELLELPGAASSADQATLDAMLASFTFLT